MIELATYLSGVAEPVIWAFALVFIRVGAVMALLPAFGEQSVPMRIKLVATVCFSLIVAPLVLERAMDVHAQNNWLSLIGTEVVAGLALGILFRLFVIALQVAGAVAAQSTSLSQLFGAGLGADPQPAFSTLLVVGGLCLAVMAGLHVHVAEALILSYDLFPIGQLISSGELADWGIGRVSSAFAFGFSLAAPFVLAGVVYNLGLGIINKAMPQLMVAFVGAPAISLGGLVLLFIASPFLLAVWVEVFLHDTDLAKGAFK